MTKLKHAYYLVASHMGGLYFEKKTGDPHQEDKIQATCETCFDNDWIQDEFDTYEDGLAAIKSQHYNLNYQNELIEKLKQLK